MAREMFVQTRLERFVPDGRQEMVSYIPAKVAIQDAIVDLKCAETDRWTRGWRVMDLCPTEEWRSYDVVNEQSQTYKSQRVGSDIESGSREKMKKRRR